MKNIILPILIALLPLGAPAQADVLAQWLEQGSKAAQQAGLCMRLSYAAPTVPQITEAVARLGRAWGQAVS